ncbi:hypothetical protein CV103_05745 [Sphingomonas fennica]|uniref:Uncharacterized protein n=1 Tax=Edaphosphingomonas fennica TaxID=114404 RepID=A0A2T4I5S0_9SPHN|nr:hypothetical protein CV103_05745 [Sphingomonas fennica]
MPLVLAVPGRQVLLTHLAAVDLGTAKAVLAERGSWAPPRPERREPRMAEAVLAATALDCQGAQVA